MTSYLFLLIAMLSIQTGASLAKQLFPLAGAAGVTNLRLFFATLILWFIWRPWNYKFSRQDLKNLFIYGACLGFMNLAFYFALERIPLGIAVTLEFMGPLCLAVFTSKRKLDYFWAVLAGVGIFLIFPKTNFGQGLNYWGVGFALLAGVFWAAYILFGQRAGKNLHGGIAASMGMFFAFIVTLPFGLNIDASKIFSYDILPMGLAVAIFSSAIPYSLEMHALKKIKAKTFSILMSIEPVIACILGLIFLSESLTMLQWIAVGCVMMASFGSSLGERN